MAHTITGKLNKAATQFQAGESTGFGLRLGVKYYDRQAKADAWTNFEATIFAKAPAQIEFYQQALIEGAIVEVSGDKLAIKQFQGNNGLSLSIELMDAKLGFVYSPNQQSQRQTQPAMQQPQQRPQQAQQNYQSQQQSRQAPTQGHHNQMPQQHNQHQPQYQDFQDDIPF